MSCYGDEFHCGRAEARNLGVTVGTARLLDKTTLYANLIPAIEEVLAARGTSTPRDFQP